MQTQNISQPFHHTNPFSSISVNNIAKAKDFYQNVLGLTVTEEDMGYLAIHLDYGQLFMAYPKEDHTPASFTVLNFPVEDIKKEVESLKAKGVKFEQYEYTDPDGIARNMGPLMAWFKDPSGNIMSVVQEK